MKYFFVIVLAVLVLGCANAPQPPQPSNSPTPPECVPLEGAAGSIIASATGCQIQLVDENNMVTGVISIVDGKLFWTPQD